MVNFKLKPVFLLYTFTWISVSAFEFHTVEVQPGDEVSLQSSNCSSLTVRIFWFRVTNRPNASQISSMINSESKAFFYDGFQNGKFRMTSNTSVLFLEIKQVDSSDSGLYFCGEPNSGKLILCSVTRLKVEEDRSHSPLNVIVGCLTVFLLLVIFGLLVKIRKLHTAQDERQNPQHSESVDSDDVNYAALSFHPKATVQRPVSQSELEPNAVYAATR